MVNIADILVENCVGSHLKLGMMNSNQNTNKDINEVHDGLSNYRFDETNKKD